jgi:hypothetical protein
MKECCLNGDINTAEKYLSEAKTYFNQYKEEAEKYRKMKDCNFGILNNIMESCIAESTAKNKKIGGISKCVNIIKEDKNLINEARFYNAILSYDGSIDAKKFVNEALSLVSGKVDAKTMDKSAKKLADEMFSTNLTNMETIDEGYEQFAKDCDYLLRTKKRLDNISLIEGAVNRIADYITENKRAINEACAVYGECDDFDKHFKQLNESERELVNDIIAGTNQVKEERQEKIFNFYQAECLKHIDTLIEDADGDNRNKLTSLKEQIASKEYNRDSIVKDISKFLQIGSI